jgi:hypothetical protein
MGLHYFEEKINNWLIAIDSCITNVLFNLSFPPRIKYGVNSNGNPEKGNGTGFLLSQE